MSTSSNPLGSETCLTCSRPRRFLVHRIGVDAGGHPFEGMLQLADGSPVETAGLPMTRMKQLATLMNEIAHDPEVALESRIRVTHAMLAIGFGIEPRCIIPPTGWRCMRAQGHAGPCAAIPAEDIT